MRIDERARDELTERLSSASTPRMICPGFPGYRDHIVLLDSTQSSADARSRHPGAPSWPTPARITTAAATPAGFGACACTCWAPPDGTIRAAIVASADDKERDVARRLFALALRGGETIVCDKG